MKQQVQTQCLANANRFRRFNDIGTPLQHRPFLLRSSLTARGGFSCTRARLRACGKGNRPAFWAASAAARANDMNRADQDAPGLAFSGIRPAVHSSPFRSIMNSASSNPAFLIADLRRAILRSQETGMVMSRPFGILIFMRSPLPLRTTPPALKEARSD
jgi:hypothetical protein